RPVAASGPCSPRPKSRDSQRAHRVRSGCADSLPPQPRDGEWSDAGAGSGGDNTFGVLHRLAERLLGSPGRKRRLREATMSTSDPTRRELLKLTAATGGALAAGQLLPGAAPPATAQTANAVPAPLKVTLRDLSRNRQAHPRAAGHARSC